MTKETRQLWRAHAITFLTKISQIAAIFACKRGNERARQKIQVQGEMLSFYVDCVCNFLCFNGEFQNGKETNDLIGKQCVCAKVCK